MKNEEQNLNEAQTGNGVKADVSSSARYIIVNSSVSAHCCFGYTIIDTAAGKESYGDYWKRSMCETFEEEEAKIICDALNKHCC